jgi:hypothetical protein
MKNTLLLDALATRVMFILYRAVPREDGKTDKLPTHPTTGGNIDGQDRSNWMLPHEAKSWADQWNLAKPPGVLSYGVGLVIHEGCGIFALDFDGCRETHGGWMAHVVSFEGRFPEAYRETSLSATGRHVFGSYTGSFAHGTRNKLYRMEAYTKARFMALTGDEAAGNILADCTKALGAFLGEYFPEHEEAEHGVEWTTAPVAAWKGPTDDAQLVARATRSIALKAVFGGGAAFSDLWRAEAETLAKAFPSQNSYSQWDGSAADQALANHLAFWTGNDCERMLRMMKQSALVRDKWDRPDYLPRTILSACGTQHEWYSEPKLVQTANPGQELPTAPDSSQPAPSPPQIPAPPSVPAPPGMITVEMAVPSGPPKIVDKLLKPGELPPVGEYCNIAMMKQIFEGYCYVQDIHAIQILDGSTVTKERFDSMFGGPLFAMVADGQKPTKSAWDAYTLSEIHRFPRVHTQYFNPREACGTKRTREGRDEINMYQPANIRRVQGDPTPFLELVRKMLPDGQDATILLCYMAACVQNLGRKFTWWPFVQGTKGNGKTTIGKVMEYCTSHRYTHWAKADQLGEKFNEHLVGKLLLVIDEMYNDDKREFEEILKQLVTAERLEIRPMYGPKSMKEICFNGMLFSNHQNGIRIDLDERRYAAFFCAQQTKADKARDGLTKPYFIGLNAWLWGQDGAAMVYDYLMSYDIPDELNPAVGCIEAPNTTSTTHAATASLGGIEQELVEAIKQQHDGFRNGWISSQAVDFLLARCGRDKAIPRNARKGLVMSLGYVPHPSLGAEGMLDIPLADGARPRLYVEKGHPWAVDYLSPAQVREGFLEAQKRS